jgi:hypothetical protein
VLLGEKVEELAGLNVRIAFRLEGSQIQVPRRRNRYKYCDQDPFSTK